MTDRVEPAEGATGVGGGAQGSGMCPEAYLTRYDDSDHICITCGRVDGACWWADDAERCMRDQLADLRRDAADPIVAAEREVANAAVDWYNNLAKPSPTLVAAIEVLTRLRAAHAGREG